MHALIERVDAFMLRALEQGVFPGAVLVFGSSDFVELSCFGVTTHLDGGTVVNENTIYDIASLSKLFTATAALQLLERGEIRLDDPVGRFLPAFAQGEKAGLRLRHLLTHTSGLPAHRPFYETAQSKSDMLNLIAQTPLEYPLGTRVVYSCLGFIVLANVIEAVAAQPLDKYLYENVFLPLGMATTCYGRVSKPREDFAPTELCSWRGRLAWGEVHDENAYSQGGVSGNAGIFSTGPDLALFAQMMLNQGMIANKSVLSPATIRTAICNYTAGLDENRGLGWQLRSNGLSWCGDLARPNSFGHNGFTGTSLWISPDDDLFVILLCNRVHPTRENNQHIRLRPLLHNLIIASWSGKGAKNN